MAKVQLEGSSCNLGVHGPAEKLFDHHVVHRCSHLFEDALQLPST